MKKDEKKDVNKKTDEKISSVNIYYRGSSMYVDPKEALDRAIDVLNQSVEDLKNDDAFKKDFKNQSKAPLENVVHQ
jgi:DNA-directed RNA polymerase subunit L